MNASVLWAPILIPLATGLLVLPMRGKSGLREILAIMGSLATLIVAICLIVNVWPHSEAHTTAVSATGVAVEVVKTRAEMFWHGSWAGFGMDMSLRLYQFSAFILTSAAFFAFMVCVYCFRYMRERPKANQFFAYLLITLAMVSGAVLADHLVALIFFWEGLLMVLFGMIAIGRPGAMKTAIKAFVIVGISDLCLMFGIIMAGWSAGTMTMSKMHLPLTDSFNILAFVLMMIGALAKGGAMPFHTWIPDAALDAPTPFMALVPGGIEKLTGIYLLSRITLDLFELNPHTSLSWVLMSIGAVTILLAVMMALIQKDYKKLLAYHAISQVGYMVLGIGTAVPAGIIGGLFHMINNALYKSCLFLTGGAVEQQAGTSDLKKLGGLAGKMPITFACFFVAACSISGVPPFNGFFSKELVYDGALERHFIFYLAALGGSFLTAASFLKLGHAAYLGARRPEHDNVVEAPASMLLPMMLIAATCIFFGLDNQWVLHHLIQPVLGDRLEGHDFAGWPHSARLIWLTVAVLAGAVANHLAGVRTYGSGVQAVDHIHYAPILHPIYERAERRMYDPYNIGLDLTSYLARGAWGVDKAIDWVYNRLAVGVAFFCSMLVKLAHTGDYAMYVAWALIGAGVVVWFMVS